MNEMASARRVAFFGGSFDPPHAGHLAVARAAREALGLDTILFAPVGAQPLKPEGAAAGFEDRVAMTRLAIDGEKGFEVSLADAPNDAGTPNFTLQTLKALRADLTPDSTLYCLMGADSFASLKYWRGAAEIPFVAPLIVAARPGFPLEELGAALPTGLSMDRADVASGAGEVCGLRVWLLRNDDGERTPLYVLPDVHVDVSASEIRRQVEKILSGKERGGSAVPWPVAEYILTHGLYR